MNEAGERRLRRAARVFLFDMQGNILLFRYVSPHYDPFWITPGGECEPGEAYADAAARELFEETGISAVPSPTGIVRQAEYVYLGEPVRSIEHFFLHRAATSAIDTSGHTEIEREAMQEHRWFAPVEIPGWSETIYPLDLADLAGKFRSD